MTDNRIIGREYEQHILKNICEEKEARLVAVYGRRRADKLVLSSTSLKRNLISSIRNDEKEIIDAAVPDSMSAHWLGTKYDGEYPSAVCRRKRIYRQPSGVLPLFHALCSWHKIHYVVQTFSPFMRRHPFSKM